MKVWRGQVVWFAVGVFVVNAVFCPRATAAATETPAGTMRDLRDHFAACFHPPGELAGTRVTFYFSIDHRGEIVAQPRTILFGFKGSARDRDRYVSSFQTDFARCLPLAMSKPLAASIPGKVYFLQYAVAASGEMKEVLFRPFGSHGGGGGGYVEPPRGLEPPEPVIPPVRISPVPAWMVRPRGYRPFFPPRGVFVPIPPRPPRPGSVR